jgi:hypothetical protein
MRFKMINKMKACVHAELCETAFGGADQYCGFDWDLKINGTTFRGYDKESYYFNCEIIRDQITVHIQKS